MYSCILCMIYLYVMKGETYNLRTTLESKGSSCTTLDEQDCSPIAWLKKKEDEKDDKNPDGDGKKEQQQQPTDLND